MEGSDDSMLMASLRTDGSPATIDGLPTSAPVMVASAAMAPVETLASAFTPHPAPAPKPPPAPTEPAQDMVAVDRAPTRPTPVDLPIPPSRPFDLGTIPGAAVPVAFTGPALLPPRRPAPGHSQSADAIYFADDAKLRLILDRTGDPFARLRPQRFVPLDQTR